MADTGKTLIVLCTCPNADSAATIASALVEQRLAACVNQLPGIVSTYRWQGATERTEEVLLIIKTIEPAYPALEQVLREMHPYELPEILAVPVRKGHADYLAWIRAATTPKN